MIKLNLFFRYVSTCILVRYYNTSNSMFTPQK